MNNIETITKVVLSVLLFVCLADMPYGYYQFVRFISLIVFGLLAYQAYSQNNQAMMVIYGSLAILFQPFFKISLGRELWNVVDVIVGVWLIGSIFIKKSTL